jgi:hypothetical protein
MAQSDQVVQNATFPSVRADINDNLAALYSQSSGNSAPTVTVAFQPWVDKSSSPPVWKVRNGSNSAWITVGVLDPAGFNAGGITAIANGGTGATTAALALAALLPSQGGNAGKALVTSGSAASWGTVASGASIQTFTANGTYTPTAGKTTFLVFITGGGGGSSGCSTAFSGSTSSNSGGAGGTAIRLFNTTELGSSASITIGGGGGGGAGGNPPSAGATGGTSSFVTTGSGGTITATGGGGASIASGGGGGGGGTSGSNVLGLEGGKGSGATIASVGGISFWGGSYGRGGNGSSSIGGSGGAGLQGLCFILEL